jgi:hypothetical protein
MKLNFESLLKRRRLAQVKGYLESTNKHYDLILWLKNYQIRSEKYRNRQRHGIVTLN